MFDNVGFSEIKKYRFPLEILILKEVNIYLWLHHIGLDILELQNQLPRSSLHAVAGRCMAG